MTAANQAADKAAKEGRRPGFLLDIDAHACVIRALCLYAGGTREHEGWCARKAAHC